MNTAVIRKSNRIAKVYYSSSEKTKELLEGSTKQLLAMAKDTLGRAAGRFHMSGKRIKEGPQKGFERVDKVERKLKVEKVSDRVVSYYEEEARALPKGKVHKPCEFGHKVRLDMNGDGYITNLEALSRESCRCRDAGRGSGGACRAVWGSV